MVNFIYFYFYNGRKTTFIIKRISIINYFKIFNISIAVKLK